jgi:hypothetical protein
VLLLSSARITRRILVGQFPVSGEPLLAINFEV